MIVDLELITKFNRYFRFLNSFESLLINNALISIRRENELEKPTNKL